MEYSTSISSIVLKNVAEELQKNVIAEMNRFQQQIIALDSIIRYTVPSVKTNNVDDVVPVKEVVSEIEIDIKNKMNEHVSNMNEYRNNIEAFINKKLTAFSESNSNMQIFINNMDTSIKNSFEILTNAFNNQSNIINELENKYAALEARLSALAVNSVTYPKNESLEEMIQTDIISNTSINDIKELTAPPSTPESEPDIEEDNVNYESTAEPDIEDEQEDTKSTASSVKQQKVVDVKKEEAVEEAEEEEEEEVEEEEEEAGEFEEVSYKGNTYYVDGDSIAYTVNDEGELNEDPVGVWVPEKKIIRFYKK